MLESTLSLCPHFLERECILMGDFNTDITNKSCPTLSGLDRCSRAFGLTQLIHEPTRVCDVSSSTIDLVLVSDPESISQSGVLTYGISDHFLTFCSRRVPRSHFNSHRFIKARSFKQYTAALLNEAIRKLNWSSVTDTVDVNLAWLNFKSLFISAINLVAPARSVRVKQRSHPWFNQEIFDAISARDKALSVFKHSRDQADFQIYKNLRNMVQLKVREAKTNFFSDQIKENKDNPKSLWSALKSLGCTVKSNPDSSPCISLQIDGKIVSEKKQIANHFNRFFTSIACKLVDCLPSGPVTFGRDRLSEFYLRLGVKPNNFSFKPASIESIAKLLKSLKCAKATGLDNIAARFLRDAADLIAPLVAYIVNLSLAQGTVPDDMKHAKTIPLFKKGCRSDPGNYRPISILSVTSKVLEKVIHQQLYEYLTVSKLLFKFQSGFRKSHSTDSCLLFLTDFIRTEMDAGKLCGMILIDLQKAFDTVDHNLLFSKLTAIGVSSSSLRWFISYLSGRDQIIDLHGQFSTALPVTCGVPQGSVLGPLLFLIYINDMYSACNVNLFLYADDSAILSSDKDVERLQSTLSDEFKRIKSWLTDNKLSLHMAKTEYVLFGSKPRLCKLVSPTIVLEGQSFVAKASVSYLGCHLDSSLGGETMALKTIQKVTGRTKFLARKFPFLDQSSLFLLANSLVSSCFDYAISSWYGGLTKVLKDKLQISQNRLIRLTLGLAPRAHVGKSLFLKLGWLPVHARFVQLQLNMVHNIYNNRAPEYLSSHFQRCGDTHSHNTRASTADLRLPCFKTNMGKCSFKFAGASNWNMLPLQIKDTNSLGVFKKKVKQWLTDKIQD